MKRRQVDGNHVLYHYLQKELQRTDYWLFQMFVARIVTTLGIWFSPETFRRLPVLVPYAVRDPQCRGSKAAGRPDEWGSPDAAGYFRDDNSLVKGLPRPLAIDSPSGLYSGRYLGNGYVASHVWRDVVGSKDLASRDPLTNTFVPNLVWLPSQVSKLTDREGSFSQRFLQAVSYMLYRDMRFPAEMQGIVDEAWRRLPKPEIPEWGLPGVEDLSLFQHEASFVRRRVTTIGSVVEGLRAAATREPIDGRIVSSRYTEGIRHLPRDVARNLADQLDRYLLALPGDSE
jgi:hypothetical protein